MKIRENELHRNSHQLQNTVVLIRTPEDLNTLSVLLKLLKQPDPTVQKIKSGLDLRNQESPKQSCEMSVWIQPGPVRPCDSGHL